jgi:hypothetical protein
MKHVLGGIVANKFIVAVTVSLTKEVIARFDLT